MLNLAVIHRFLDECLPCSIKLLHLLPRQMLRPTANLNSPMSIRPSPDDLSQVGQVGRLLAPLRAAAGKRCVNFHKRFPRALPVEDEVELRAAQMRGRDCCARAEFAQQTERQRLKADEKPASEIQVMYNKTYAI